MEKIFYDAYILRYKKKVYEILVPRLPLDEAWVVPRVNKYFNSTYVDGNSDTLENLWNALVTLAIRKMAIIYLPFKGNPMLTTNKKRLNDNYDLLLYNRQLKFNKRYWKHLHKMMQAVIPQERVISYEVSDFLRQCKRKWETIRRDGNYYSRKCYPKQWVLRSKRLLFLEGSVGLHCENADIIYEFLQRDLEEESDSPRKRHPDIGILGIRYCFTSREVYKRQRKRESVRKNGNRIRI